MEDAERKSASTLREYGNESLVVSWEPEYCIHSARCLRGAPGVFDSQRRPWIMLDLAESTDQVVKAIIACPSGALNFRRLDGGMSETVPEPTEVEPTRNGPLHVRGHVRIVNYQGEVLREATRVALCRCGNSANKPFCDATHRRIGFEAE